MFAGRMAIDKGLVSLDRSFKPCLGPGRLLCGFDFLNFGLHLADKGALGSGLAVGFKGRNAFCGFGSFPGQPIQERINLGQVPAVRPVLLIFCDRPLGAAGERLLPIRIVFPFQGRL